MNGRKKYLTTALLAVVLFCLARVADNLAQTQLVANRSINLAGDWLWLQLHFNSEFIFGWQLGRSMVLFSTAAALIGVIAGYASLAQKLDRIFSFGFAFILGGAISNLFSRYSFGAVADYIFISAFGIQGSWNVADFLIIIGAGLWLASFISDRRSPNLPVIHPEDFGKI